MRAGYNTKDPYKLGYNLLQDQRVTALIQEEMNKRAKATSITAERVLREIAVLGFSDVSHYDIDENGNVVVMPDAPEGAVRAISSVKRHINRDGSVDTELKLWDKPAALRMLGQHLALFIERQQIEIRMTHEEALELLK